MATGNNHNRYGMLIILLLIVIIAAGSAIIWSKYQPAPPLEIVLAPQPELKGEIYLGGAVVNPGYYPLKSGDRIEDLVRDAGGMTDAADRSRISLLIPDGDTVEPPQRVNINSAEAWLLEALPGIGAARAQAIIRYREERGHFRQPGDLLQVEGISSTIYENIKNLITVAE